MLQMPGVTRRGPRQVEGRPAVSEFMRGKLAEEHGAGIVELARRGRVFVGNVVRADFRMAGRADPARVVDVLQTERDAMQRPAVSAFCDFLLGFARLLKREIRGDEEKGGQLGVESGNTLQVRLRKLYGRELARADQLRRLRDRQEMKVVGHICRGTRSSFPASLSNKCGPPLRVHRLEP